MTLYTLCPRTVCTKFRATWPLLQSSLRSGLPPLPLAPLASLCISSPMSKETYVRAKETSCKSKRDLM